MLSYFRIPFSLQVGTGALIGFIEFSLFNLFLGCWKICLDEPVKKSKSIQSTFCFPRKVAKLILFSRHSMAGWDSAVQKHCRVYFKAVCPKADFSSSCWGCVCTNPLNVLCKPAYKWSCMAQWLFVTYNSYVLWGNCIYFGISLNKNYLDSQSINLRLILLVNNIQVHKLL